MGLFKKKEKIVDLTPSSYRVPVKKIAEVPKATEPVPDFVFLGDYPSQKGSEEPAEDSNEKKTKLAKRLMDMTDKIEDLSNQIYHLQQRMELIEKKVKINYE